MPTSFSSTSEKIFIDDVIDAENTSLELEQQMVWVQIRKTIPNVGFMLAIAMWATSAFAYAWETSISQTLSVNIQGFWLFIGLIIPITHLVLTGVVPFRASHYARGLANSWSLTPISWRFYVWGIIAGIFISGLWFGLWLFEASISLRIAGYVCLMAIVSLFLLAYRHHYQKSISMDY